MPSLSLITLTDKLLLGDYGSPKSTEVRTLRNNFIAMGGNKNKTKAQIVQDYIDEKLAVKEVEEAKATRQQEALESSESDFDLLVANKLHQLKDSAVRRGKEFDLTFNVVKKLLKRKTCYYTGLKFVADNNLHLTIDRIDNRKGYIVGNVVACSNWANQMKNQLLEQSDSPLLNNKKLLKKFLAKLGE
jgi:hypothetical protein